MSWLEIVRPGPLTTVQDHGRPGYASMGVGSSGAADQISHNAANRLVSNNFGAATLEITLGGFVARAAGRLTIAVTGARAPIAVNGQPQADYAVIHLDDGDLLEIGYPTVGLRTYLAVRGGIDVPAVMGSRSTDTLSNIGPEPISTGQRILVGMDQMGWPTEELIPPPKTIEDPITLRVRLGPRDGWFTPASIDALLTQTWTVSDDSNRVGARLDGPGPLHRARRGELPSEGMVAGALQVPPNGQPVLFLADHPVTGGYPVIAVVSDADISTASQLRPGQQLRFRQ